MSTTSGLANAQSPSATRFAQIPGNPIGVACVGDGDGGIEDQLVVTSYSPGNIHTVSATGSVTTKFVPGFPRNWSSIESYLAVSPGTGDWPIGPIFASFGPRIYRIEPDLSVATVFVTVAGKPGTHTGVTFDRTGVWNFDMIISFTDGTVYRVNPAGAVTFIATTRTHHEAPRVLPDDATKWGSYAGCITTASENANRVFAICPNGAVSVLATNIPGAETSDLRPSSGETTFASTPYVYFGSRYSTGAIWGYPATSFPTGSEGDMFVSREFGGGITRLAGTTSVSAFEGAFGQHYEGSNFCFRARAIDTAEDCTDGRDNDGDTYVDNDDPDCHVCGDGDVDPGEECDDGNVVDGDGCSSRCASENAAPSAVCVNVTVTAGPTCSESASVNGGSNDPDGDALTISQSPAGPYGLGTTGVTLTVSDGSLQDQCTAQVTVLDQAPPTLGCPPDVSAECTGAGSATVSTGTSTASDNCSVTVSDPPPAAYPLGTTAVAHSAIDGSGNSASCTNHVSVVDTTPPTITCAAPVTAECLAGGAVVDVSEPQTSDSCTTASANDVPAQGYPLGTTSVVFAAADTSGNSASCATSVTVVDTTAPTIVCADPVVAECVDGAAFVDVIEAAATDSCGQVSVNDVPGQGYSLGTTTVGFTATDGVGNTSSCATSVSVVDTLPPAIICPPAVTAECENGQAFVDVGAAAASDQCGQVAVSTIAPQSYPLGQTSLTFTASDAQGLSSACQTEVNVVDTTPPVVTASGAAPLWSPNHKYHRVSLDDCGVTVADGCGGTLTLGQAGAAITCVTSDEVEDAKGGGDGNTLKDIVIVDGTTVDVRAERQGGGNGRAYEIHFAVQDGAGNTQTGTCAVGVPHDQSPSTTIVDDGDAYTVCR